MVDVLKDIGRGENGLEKQEPTGIWEISDEKKEAGDSETTDPLLPVSLAALVPVQRFGTSLDVWAFRTMRSIAAVDQFWVSYLATFATISPVRAMTHTAGVVLVDAALNMLYTACVILQLRTSVVVLETGREYVDPVLIVRQRLVSLAFWADLLSCLGGLWSILDLHVIALFRLLRCWRLPGSTYFLYELSRGQIEEPIFALLELVLSMCLVIHLFACAWFSTIIAGLDESSDLHWLDHKLGHSRYLSCLHAGTALLSGSREPEAVAADDGYTDIEAFACIVLGPIGAVYLAFIFAKSLTLLESVNQSTDRYRNRVSEVIAMLNSLTVPADLKGRILTYHTFLSIHNVPSSEQNKGAYHELCEGMSRNLHQELKIHLFETLVLSAPFFQEMPSQVVVQMVIAFNEAVYGPGDMIIVQGEPGTQLFFVVKGSCDVLIQTEEGRSKKVATKQAGDYFGEVALVLDQKRTASIVARSFCILAKLTRDAFETVLNDCPLVKETMILQIIRQSGVKFLKTSQASDGSNKSTSRDDTLRDGIDDTQTVQEENCPNNGQQIEGLQSARRMPRSARRPHKSDCPELVTEPAPCLFEETEDNPRSAHQYQFLQKEIGIQQKSSAVQKFEREARHVLEESMRQMRLILEATHCNEEACEEAELNELTRDVRKMRVRLESIDHRLRHVEVARATKRHKEILQSMLAASQSSTDNLLKTE